MNRKALHTLEYNKIIDQLTSHASSVLGREQCAGSVPVTDLAVIEQMQLETADALQRLFQKGNLSFGSVRDIRPQLTRLSVGSTLGIGELIALSRLLSNAARVKAYGRRPDDAPDDSLSERFSLIEPLTPLAAEIDRCILSEDEISDDASSSLRQIRRQIKQANDRIHSQLSQMVSGSARDYLQDSLITTRGGRYCIPVKAEYRNQVSGIIHDQSATGSTLFVEPAAIVKLNNDIQQLEVTEQEEIERILASLSEQAALYQTELTADLSLLVDLDCIFARAALAMEMNASRPLFNQEGRITIKRGRHPLIDKKKVVPIDISLGGAFSLLVITGPNTGGKTVTLKTVGLLTLMGQSGLHIPAFDRSELSVFNEVYADIGDEQSIEQSLSTFSSHMTNVISFLEKADEHSLVLFDELGAGTDPTEGAALAISILSDLHSRGVHTIATTHYSELKLYALSTPGVENGCCEFNVETLSPTYRLLIGVPGKSNAFAISSKLGLPDYIIEKAKEQISEENESFEDVISDLESSRKEIERKQLEIEQNRKEVESLRQTLRDRNEKLAASRDKIIDRANEEARAILQEAKSYADQTIRDFNKFGKDTVSARELEAHREAIRKRLDATHRKKDEPVKPRSHEQLRPSDLHVGDAVKVISMNLKGTVSTMPDARGNLFVQMGIMRSKVHLSDLILIDDVTISAPGLSASGSGTIKISKSAGISSEINLIGKTVDEGVALLDKYLDDAWLAHLTSVRIVHGKGTGKLRDGVQKFLKKNTHVKSFRLGEYGEGDAGVTIVEFKQ